MRAGRARYVPAMNERRDQDGQERQPVAGGVFILLSLIVGIVIGIATGQISLGMVIGLAVGLFIAIAIWILDRMRA